MRHVTRARPAVSVLVSRGVHSMLSTSWHLDALNVTLLVVGVFLLYGLATHFVPAGADPGNWLGIANERLGRDVMAADVTYLPLFPGLLAGLLSIWGPIVGFDVAAIITISALATAVYLCTRTLGRGYALAAAIVAGTRGIRWRPMRGAGIRSFSPHRSACSQPSSCFAITTLVCPDTSGWDSSSWPRPWPRMR